MCDQSYVWKYGIEKRICAMVRDHGFIDYMFRDFNNTLLTRRDIVEQLLEEVLDSITKKRRILINKGATTEQISRYDSMVRKCFNKSINIIRNRATNIDNPYMNEDLILLQKILQLGDGDGCLLNYNGF